MAVFNRASYLDRALQSILAQTFTDFEFIIVDDGSTDGTPAGLRRSAARDQRIVLIRNEHNLGLTRALNKGLARASGEFVARMDSDDISLPERFQQQVAFFDSHPRHGLLGCWIQKIDLRGRVLAEARLPVTHAEIMPHLLHASHFCHSAVMLRRVCLERVGGYREEVGRVEDYDLWLRISRQFEVHNLPRVLHQWRLNTQTGISVKQAAELAPLEMRVKRDFLPGFLNSDPAAYATLEQALCLYPRDKTLREFYLRASSGHEPRRAVLALDAEPADYAALAEDYRAANRPILAHLSRLAALQAAPAPAEVFPKAIADIDLVRQSEAAPERAGSPDACAVSVIVPTAGASPGLEESLASLRAQTFRDFEALVVPWAEAESVARVVRAQVCDNIRCLPTQAAGLWAALNAGLTAARGKYIAYLSDAEVFYPAHLEILMRHAAAQRAEIVCARAHVRRGEVRAGRFVPRPDEGTLTQDLFAGGPGQTCVISRAKILHLRKALREIGHFNAAYPAMDNWAFWQRWTQAGAVDKAYPLVGDWDYWQRWSERFEIHHLDDVTCEIRQTTAAVPQAEQAEARLLLDLLRIYHFSNGGDTLLARAAAALGHPAQTDAVLGRWADGVRCLSSEQYEAVFPLLFRRSAGGSAAQRSLFRYSPVWFVVAWANQVTRLHNWLVVRQTAPDLYLRLAGFAVRHAPVVLAGIVNRLRRWFQRRLAGRSNAA